MEAEVSNRPKSKSKAGKKKQEPNYAMPNHTIAPVNLRHPVSIATGPSTSVRHREMVGTYTVTTATDFSTQLFLSQRLNPANSILFPWASRIARNYEKYIVRNVKFIVVSNNATSTPGWLAGAVDRDSADPAPSSKQDLMNLGYAKADAVWSGFEFSIPNDNCLRFVDSQVTATDQRLVDFGRFNLAAYSSLSGATLDLYVQYEFDFYIPSSNYTNMMVVNTSLLWTADNPFTGVEVLGPGYLVPDTLRFKGHLVFTTTGTFLIASESEGTGMNSGGWTQESGTSINSVVVGGGETATRASFVWLVRVTKTGIQAYIRNTPPPGAAFTRSRLAVIPVSASEADFFAR
jgi:hypothetical protein